MNKPWFAYRPAQLIRRLRVPDADSCDVALPWGHVIEVCPREAIGSSIARTGVFELAISELIARLLKHDDLAVDAGANIGYMTSLMSSRARRVVAFEPHPVVYSRLQRNAARWPDNIEIRQVALSDRPGEATLVVGDVFEANMGTASIGDGPGLRVRTERLDELVAGPIGLLKLDVEGHELSVLQGAGLDRVRDVVFEEQGPLPTPVTAMLEESGFTVFGLAQRFRGVELTEPGVAGPIWDAPTYLATRDPSRARRCVGRGWTVLGKRAR
jgi:FkbM family methyltransferase